MPYPLAADREYALLELDAMHGLTSHPSRGRGLAGYFDVWRRD
jgi:hypothetical protein